MIKLSLFVLFVFYNMTHWHCIYLFCCCNIFAADFWAIYLLTKCIKKSKYLMKKIIAKVVVKTLISFSLILLYVCWLALFCG